MRDWYTIRAKAGADHAEILIYGDIGESWWSDETVTAKKLVEDLQQIDAKAITVRLNGFGGAVVDGLAIFNALQRHPAAITTSNDGVAMSIASLIFMAGSTRRAAANSLTMELGLKSFAIISTKAFRPGAVICQAGVRGTKLVIAGVDLAALARDCSTRDPRLPGADPGSPISLTIPK